MRRIRIIRRHLAYHLHRIITRTADGCARVVGGPLWRRGSGGPRWDGGVYPEFAGRPLWEAWRGIAAECESEGWDLSATGFRRFADIDEALWAGEPTAVVSSYMRAAGVRR